MQELLKRGIGNWVVHSLLAIRVYAHMGVGDREVP